MEYAVINTRIGAEDKIAFEEMCRMAGLSVSSALRAFVSAVVGKGAMPFSSQVDPFYSPENQAHLRECIEQFKRGQVTEHELIEV